MELSERDRGMLEGEAGPAAALAMTIVTRMRAIVGATRLIDITHAHIDSSIYVGDAGLEFAERLAGCVLALPWTRGSSTATAILLPKADTFIALAAVVAQELYRRSFTVAVMPTHALEAVTGQMVQIEGWPG